MDGAFPLLGGGFAVRGPGFAGKEVPVEGGRLLLFCVLPWLVCMVPAGRLA